MVEREMSGSASVEQELQNRVNSCQKGNSECKGDVQNNAQGDLQASVMLDLGTHAHAHTTHGQSGMNFPLCSKDGNDVHGKGHKQDIQDKCDNCDAIIGRDANLGRVLTVPRVSIQNPSCEDLGTLWDWESDVNGTFLREHFASLRTGNDMFDRIQVHTICTMVVGVAIRVLIQYAGNVQARTSRQVPIQASKVMPSLRNPFGRRARPRTECQLCHAREGLTVVEGKGKVGHHKRRRDKVRESVGDKGLFRLVRSLVVHGAFHGLDPVETGAEL